MYKEPWWNRKATVLDVVIFFIAIALMPVVLRWLLGV